MSTAHPPIALGYSDVPPGHVASVVTCLEMRAKPQQETLPLPEGITLDPLVNVDLVAYRALFRKIGAKWLWFSRLYMADDKLSSILNDPNVEAWIIRDGEAEIGMLELDFSEPGQCELVFLGLTEATTGKGLGRAIMSNATERAWAKPIERFWVHTCTFDHPSALSFYMRSGFVPYAFQVEVQADPRLTGHLPADAAPHIPLIS